MTYKRSAKKGKRSREVDTNRFVDAEAEDLYNERFSTLTPLVEREVALEEFSHTLVPQLFPFSVEHPCFPYSATTCPSLDTMTSLLAKRPLLFNGKGFSAVAFTAEVMLVSRILGTNILPAQKLSALSLDRAKFLYAFMHNDSIDLGSVMCAHIIKCYHSRKTGLYLPYACAIQKLIITLEVPYPSSFPKMDTSAKIGLSTLTQIISHKKKAQSASPSPMPTPGPSSVTDNKYLMECMKLLLEQSSSMVTDISLLKADSQLTRTEVLQMQGSQAKLLQAMDRLILENDLLTASNIVLQAESSKNRADIQWIRQYLGQEEADDAAAPSSAVPSSSQPQPSATEYFSSDEDNHEGLSDLD
ncbi:hypothetical protein CJ030_MR0G005880 [Morella rubra]|uniref:Putative plant transposon protein domain-containing protein n=1 Tax=Morella rubra TaxID=262757 RepID=A0A6A1UKC3_9ROSI|nr:hypothetical protein CJ030_MR0G005880 [Morella rubra]